MPNDREHEQREEGGVGVGFGGRDPSRDSVFGGGDGFNDTEGGREYSNNEIAAYARTTNRSWTEAKEALATMKKHGTNPEEFIGGYRKLDRELGPWSGAHDYEPLGRIVDNLRDAYGSYYRSMQRHGPAHPITQYNMQAVLSYADALTDKFISIARAVLAKMKEGGGSSGNYSGPRITSRDVERALKGDDANKLRAGKTVQVRVKNNSFQLRPTSANGGLVYWRGRKERDSLRLSWIHVGSFKIYKHAGTGGTAFDLKQLLGTIQSELTSRQWDQINGGKKVYETITYKKKKYNALLQRKSKDKAKVDIEAPGRGWVRNVGEVIRIGANKDEGAASAGQAWWALSGKDQDRVLSGRTVTDKIAGRTYQFRIDARRRNVYVKVKQGKRWKAVGSVKVDTIDSGVTDQLSAQEVLDRISTKQAQTLKKGRRVRLKISGTTYTITDTNKDGKAVVYVSGKRIGEGRYSDRGGSDETNYYTPEYVFGRLSDKQESDVAKGKKVTKQISGIRYTIHDKNKDGIAVVYVKGKQLGTVKYDGGRDDPGRADDYLSTTEILRKLSTKDEQQLRRGRKLTKKWNRVTYTITDANQDGLAEVYVKGKRIGQIRYSSSGSDADHLSAQAVFGRLSNKDEDKVEDGKTVTIKIAGKTYRVVPKANRTEANVSYRVGTKWERIGTVKLSGKADDDRDPPPRDNDDKRDRPTLSAAEVIKRLSGKDESNLKRGRRVTKRISGVTYTVTDTDKDGLASVYLKGKRIGEVRYSGSNKPTKDPKEPDYLTAVAVFNRLSNRDEDRVEDGKTVTVKVSGETYRVDPDKRGRQATVSVRDGRKWKKIGTVKLSGGNDGNSDPPPPPRDDPDLLSARNAIRKLSGKQRAQLRDGREIVKRISGIYYKFTNQNADKRAEVWWSERNRAGSFSKLGVSTI